MEDADELVEEAQTFLSETVSRLTDIEQEEQEEKRRREAKRQELLAAEEAERVRGEEAAAAAEAALKERQARVEAPKAPTETAENTGKFFGQRRAPKEPKVEDDFVRNALNFLQSGPRKAAKASNSGVGGLLDIVDAKNNNKRAQPVDNRKRQEEMDKVIRTTPFSSA
eukprot:588511-Prorocentrum_minimum.AAC.2